MKAYRNRAARTVSALCLAGAFVLVSAARSEAALIVWLCNDINCSGAGDFTITDAVIAGQTDSNTDLGRISIQAPAGFPGTVTATSSPAIGNLTQPYLNVTYSFGAGLFALVPNPFIYAAQTGFTTPPVTSNWTTNASAGGGTATLYSGPGSFTPPGIAADLRNTCANIGAPGCTNLTANLPGSMVGYYLAIRINPTLSTGNLPFSSSGDSTVTTATVPDGGSTAALLGSVLVGFGLLRRRFSNS